MSEVSTQVSEQHAYCIVASSVRSVISFSKVAYPDLVGGDGPGIPAPLNGKDRKVCRSKLLTCVDRGLHPGAILHEISYDLDQIARDFDHREDDKILCNRDEERIGKRNGDSNQLIFESRFESGNLRKAVQVKDNESSKFFSPRIIIIFFFLFYLLSSFSGGSVRSGLGNTI